MKERESTDYKYKEVEDVLKKASSYIFGICGKMLKDSGALEWNEVSGVKSSLFEDVHGYDKEGARPLREGNWC